MLKKLFLIILVVLIPLTVVNCGGGGKSGNHHHDSVCRHPKHLSKKAYRPKKISRHRYNLIIVPFFGFCCWVVYRQRQLSLAPVIKI